MKRRGIAALFLVAMLLPACGKYGPPVRPNPTDDARVAELAREEAVADAPRDAEEETAAEAPDDAPDDADEKAREEAPQ
jgi:hypothetical protein